MIALPGIIEALVDAPTLDLVAAADVLSSAEPSLASFDLERLIDLARRLPTGLVRAESLWAVSEAPNGVAPLAPGSAWYAVDRTLITVVPPGRESLIRLVGDLACYAMAAWQVHQRLDGATGLLDALAASTPLAASAATQVALRLDASPDLVAALDVRAPGLRGDLAALGRVSFAPEVHIHASVRPAHGIRRGAEIARALITDLGPAPIWLVVSDSHGVVEHLSPYVRDLGHALTTWGLENAGALSTSGLAVALGEAGASPDPDLSALVVPDLFGQHPELLEERRGNERDAGLVVEDRGGTVWGRCDLAALEDADPTAVAEGAAGVLVVIAGGGHETLVEAARLLFDEGHVEAFAAVFGTAGPAAPVVVPEAVVTDEDAIRLPDARSTAATAEAIGLEILRPPALPIDGASGVPPAVLQLLRLVRRAEVCGDFPVDGPNVLVLSARPRPGVAPDLATRLGPIRAARLALAALAAKKSYESPSAEQGSKSLKSARFRV